MQRIVEYLFIFLFYFLRVVGGSRRSKRPQKTTETAYVELSEELIAHVYKLVEDDIPTYLFYLIFSIDLVVFQYF